MSSFNPEIHMLSGFTKHKSSLPLSNERTPIALISSANQNFLGLILDWEISIQQVFFIRSKEYSDCCHNRICRFPPLACEFWSGRNKYWFYLLAFKFSQRRPLQLLIAGNWRENADFICKLKSFVGAGQ